MLSEKALQALPSNTHQTLYDLLISLKWRLWHGRYQGAQQRMKSLLFTLKLPSIRRKVVTKKLRTLGQKLQTYLTNNADSIPHYGQRYRNGERIASAFVESAVNRLIDKRMSKSQQMCWSSQGARDLLRVRVEIIDGRLGEHFAHWYPGFNQQELQPGLAA